MNNAQIDFLPLLPLPRAETGLSQSRSRDAAPVFDNLFRQASDSTAPTQSFSSSRAARTDGNDSQCQSSNPASASDSQSRTDKADRTEALSAEDDRSVDEQYDEEDDQTRVVAANEGPEPDSQAQAIEVTCRLDTAHMDQQQVTSEAALNSSAAESKTKAKPNKAPANSAENTTAANAADAIEQTKTSSPATAHAEAVEPDQLTANSETLIAETHQEADVSSNLSISTTASIEVPKELGVDAEVVSELQSESGLSRPATSSTFGKDLTTVATREPLETQNADSPDTSDSTGDSRAVTSSDDEPSTTTERSVASGRPSAAQAAPIALPTTQQLQSQADATADLVASNTESQERAVEGVATPKENLLSPFTRFERGVSGTHHGQRAGQIADTPHVDPARFVSRVARAILTAQERGGPLQLRLAPPELGAIRLKLSVQQGALTATIETDNAAARQTLLENLPALRDRLAEQNVRIEKFDVDVRRDGSCSQQFAAPQDRGDQQRQGQTPNRSGSPRELVGQIGADEPATVRRSITNTSINVIA